MKLVARWAQVAASKSEDLPSSGAFWSFVAAGYFARDHRGPQLAFCQIIGGIDAVVIQKGKEMIALFIDPFAHGFFVRFAAGRLQQLNGLVFEGLTQITEDFQAKVGFPLLECDGSAQYSLHFA